MCVLYILVCVNVFYLDFLILLLRALWSRKAIFFKEKIDYNWTPISNMGENIALSVVVATEDSNFCNHLGLDINEIYKVIRRGEKEALQQ